MPVDEKTTTRLLALFKGLSLAHGTYTAPDETRDDGKRLGVASTKRVPKDADKTTYWTSLWIRHLAGEVGLGIVPIDEDGTCVFGAIDVDDYHIPQVDLIEGIRKLDAGPLVVCRSKSGGSHIFCFVKQPVQASLMRKKLAEIASGLGQGRCELFPKQSKLLIEREDFGSWINMPYFNGMEGFRYGVRPDGEPMPLEEFLLVAERSRVDKSFFDSVSEKKDPRKKSEEPKEEISDGPPCLQHLIKIGLPPGARNEGLFAFAIYYKKARPDVWSDLLEDANRRICSPPLSSTEMIGIIKAHEKKGYDYPCSKQPIVSYCNSGLCRGRRYGVGSNGSRFPELGALTKLDTDPPMWFWDVDGHRIEFGTAQLMNPRDFQAKVLEKINMMVQLPTQQVWQNLVNAALENVTIIEAPDDSSEYAQFYQHLQGFCTGFVKARSMDEILLGKSWDDGDKKTWFRLQDLTRYLDRQHFKIQQNMVVAALKKIGAGHEFKNIRGRGVNLWVIDQYDVDETPIDVSPEIGGDDAF